MPKTKSSSLLSELDDIYVDPNKTSKSCINALTKETVNNVLKKSVIQPGFLQLERIPGCTASIKQKEKDEKIANASCKGPKWFNMKTPAMTSKIQNDLKVIQMRSIFSPKEFYKKNDIKGLPKHFQVGKYMDSAADFYSSRLPKKQRKNTIVEELMADAEFVKYQKRKHKEEVRKQKKPHLKAHQRAKKLKSKNRKRGK